MPEWRRKRKPELAISGRMAESVMKALINPAKCNLAENGKYSSTIATISKINICENCGENVYNVRRKAANESLWQWKKNEMKTSGGEECSARIETSAHCRRAT